MYMYLGIVAALHQYTHVLFLKSHTVYTHIPIPPYSHTPIHSLRELLADDPGFLVPAVIPELSTKRILTTQLIHGMPLDQCASLSQEVKNDVSAEPISQFTSASKMCVEEIIIYCICAHGNFRSYSRKGVIPLDPVLYCTVAAVLMQ